MFPFLGLSLHPISLRVPLPRRVSWRSYRHLFFVTSAADKFFANTKRKKKLFERYTPHSSYLIILLLFSLNAPFEYHWIWCRLKHLLFGNAVTHSRPSASKTVKIAKTLASSQISNVLMTRSPSEVYVKKKLVTYLNENKKCPFLSQFIIAKIISLIAYVFRKLS